MTEAADPTRRFAAAIGEPRLDVALLAMAAHDHEVDIDVNVTHLDQLAESCRSASDIGALAHLLFTDRGFRGNADDYYDADNSFLDRVLERGLGIPITLSVVLLEVGRRIGVGAVGVGMPGHFMVRSESDPDLFVDAFNGGEVLDRAACEHRFREVMGPGAAFDEHVLAPATPHAIVARVLNNLQQLYGRRGDAASLAWVRRLTVLVPDAARRN